MNQAMPLLLLPAIRLHGGAAARQELPQFCFAGHLNKPNDEKFMDLFDRAITNHGFGSDQNAIKRLKDRAVKPQLYNTGQPCLSAGSWLRTTGAER